MTETGYIYLTAFIKTHKCDFKLNSTYKFGIKLLVCVTNYYLVNHSNILNYWYVFTF